MTPAEDESKLNTLIAKLVKFKNLWDRDGRLYEVLQLLWRTRERYAGYTIRRTAWKCTTFYRRPT
jgi:ornithine decarboxylase